MTRRLRATAGPFIVTCAECDDAELETCDSLREARAVGRTHRDQDGHSLESVLIIRMYSWEPTEERE